MQIIITHGTLARTRVLHVGRLQFAAGAGAMLLLLWIAAGTVWHFIGPKAAGGGWTGVAAAVAPEQRDRYLRENLDAMARRIGEMQAKLVKLEAMGERVSGLAGVRADEFAAATRAAAGSQGGPFVPAQTPSFEQLDALVGAIDRQSDHSGDLYTYIEARLSERRLQALMIPTSRPVEGSAGSGFGFRVDPFSGHNALHTGLDFPADTGTPIWAAAGGVVLSADAHPAYGRMLEIDHGNGVVTRYAHTAKVHVKAGDIVRRGQRVADVGTSGRSTGPHLHFEVLVDGAPQDPARFLAGGPGLAERVARKQR
jgi:murein DD-endopeptidase MepM/ murein hydrolase activator NlpD